MGSRILQVDARTQGAALRTTRKEEVQDVHHSASEMAVPEAKKVDLLANVEEVLLLRGAVVERDPRAQAARSLLERLRSARLRHTMALIAEAPEAVRSPPDPAFVSARAMQVASSS